VTKLRPVASTEASCLRQIPSQNAEHGVVRNYMRTSVFFPYPRIVSDSSNGFIALPWNPPPPGSDIRVCIPRACNYDKVSTPWAFYVWVVGVTLHKPHVCGGVW
jgi:hypothetical protein